MALGNDPYDNVAQLAADMVRSPRELEPWEELLDRLEQHYRQWQFAHKHFMVPADTTVANLYHAMHVFWERHQEARCLLQVFEPTFIEIVRSER